jgi:enterochelin esterase family protein
MGARSELAMPAYHRPPVTVAQPDTPTGTLQPGPLPNRATTVYLPPGYAPDAAGAGYPSVYFQDGGEYLTLAQAPVILDNLIAARQIPPLVAIFVPPVRREVEYNCDDHYVRFFSEELVPAMTAAYALHPDRMRRAVIGPSLGGLIALYLGSQRPDLFGLIGAQSSGVHSQYGRGTYDARRAYARPAKLPQRLALAIGSYEACFSLDRLGRCRDLLTPVRELQARLQRAGVAHAYAEHPQSHSWGLWRDTLPALLAYLFADA